MSGRPPLVDAHVHLWDLRHLRYAWLTPPFDDGGPNGSVEAIAHDYLLDDYMRDAAGWDVRGIVHVEAGADPADALAETDWLQATAARRGLPLGVVAFAALNDPRVERLLAAHAERPNVRGIRHIVNWHPDAGRTYTDRDLTTDPAWREGYALLAEYGLSFDLQAYPAQFAPLAPFLAGHPGTPVVLNHTGMMVGEEGRDQWRQGMRALAALPHVHVKLSGMGFAFRPWTPEQAREYLLETVDAFGPRRCMVASDFPTDRLFGGFDQHLDTYSEVLSGFSEEERGGMFGGNANRIYRLGLDL